MIDGIDRPIIILQQRSLEALKKWLLHYLGIEGRVIVEPIMQYQGMVTNGFNLLIQLSKFSLDLKILDGRGL